MPELQVSGGRGAPGPSPTTAKSVTAPARAHRPGQVRREVADGAQVLGERVVRRLARAATAARIGAVLGAGPAAPRPGPATGVGARGGTPARATCVPRSWRSAGQGPDASGVPAQHDRASRARGRAPTRSRCRAGSSRPSVTGRSEPAGGERPQRVAVAEDQHPPVGGAAPARPPGRAAPPPRPAVSPPGTGPRPDRPARARSRGSPRWSCPRSRRSPTRRGRRPPPRRGSPASSAVSRARCRGRVSTSAKSVVGQPVAQRRGRPARRRASAAGRWSRCAGRRGSTRSRRAGPATPRRRLPVTHDRESGTPRACHDARHGRPHRTLAAGPAAGRAASARSSPRGFVFISLTTRLPDFSRTGGTISELELSLLLLMMVLLAGLGSRASPRRLCKRVDSAVAAARRPARLIAVAVPVLASRAGRSGSSSPRWRSTAWRSASSTPPRTCRPSRSSTSTTGRSCRRSTAPGPSAASSARPSRWPRRDLPLEATAVLARAAAGRAVRAVPAPRRAVRRGGRRGAPCPGGRSCWSGWRWCSSTWSTPRRSPGDRRTSTSVFPHPVRPGRAGDLPLPGGQRRGPARRRRPGRPLRRGAGAAGRRR